MSSSRPFFSPTPEDRDQMKTQGLSEAVIYEQLETFSRGFPPVRLVRACTVGDGIERVRHEETERLVELYGRACGAGRVSMFVPASGAATRMFKSLLAVYRRDGEAPEKKLSDLSGTEAAEGKALKRFWDGLPRFAFYETLRDGLNAAGQDAACLEKDGCYIPVLEHLLTERGLNYAGLPKGLIPFHRYGEEIQNAFEEHLAEAAGFCADGEGRIRMHFTVAPDFREAVRACTEAAAGRCAGPDRSFEIGLSHQEASTDTIAVNKDNTPFRDGSGRLLFRPSGHGALLTNLERLQADLVFIKNIDNILPDDRRAPVIACQKMLTGYLIEMQDRIFDLLRRLAADGPGKELLKETRVFLRDHLGEDLSPDMSCDEQVSFIRECLYRPMRVCGMVKNEGEPGGGPFWVQDSRGRVARQIVEKSQVDLQNGKQAEILAGATHFNPVALVCGLRDFEGRNFDLARFVDPETGFISAKSSEGRELKALERPGLWNGSMARWITFFVEIPIETFCPVKEVNDLLRPLHQPRP